MIRPCRSALRILIAPFVIDAQMDRRIFALRAIREAVIPSNSNAKNPPATPSPTSSATGSSAS